MLLRHVGTQGPVAGPESSSQHNNRLFSTGLCSALKKRLAATVVAALLPLSLSACAPLLVLGALSSINQAAQTYPGERKPTAESAILYVKGNGKFLALDDTWKGSENYGLDVIPGKHRVTMRGCQEEGRMVLCGTRSMDVDVKAGETYDMWVWLIRDSNSLIVLSNDVIVGAHWEIVFTKRGQQTPVS